MMLRQILVPKHLLAIVFLFLFTSAFPQKNLIGKWVDIDHREKQIEVYLAQDNKIYGKSEKGFIVLKDLVYDIKTNTYTGTLVNPADSEAINITILQPSINRFTFVVKKFIFSKRFTFEKIVNQ
jgi:hypothetical protein